MVVAPAPRAQGIDPKAPPANAGPPNAAPPSSATLETPVIPEPAPTAADHGFSLGARVGWAFPIGSISAGDTLSSNFSGMLPVVVDAGYRVGRQVYLGGSFQWAAVFVSSDVCPRNLTCSGNDLKVGVNVLWHFKSLMNGGGWAGRFDPWVGLGIGYEWTITHLETLAGDKASETNHGIEYANLQLGTDYEVSGALRVGPFSSLSIAEYLWQRHNEATGSTSFTLPDRTLHFWLTVGIRGQYDL
jgi:hypothetical protein